MAAVTVTGDAEIDRALARFEPSIQKKGLRKALRNGAKVVQRAAIARAPIDSGDLEKSIKVRALKRTRRGTIGSGISAGADFANPELPFYAFFLEFGTKERHHKSGKSVGRIDPTEHDFLRSSLYESESQVKSGVITDMRAWLREYVAKKR